MKIEWSAFAIQDRDSIFDFIEAESPKAAVLVDGRIDDQVNQLARFPEFGRLGRVDGTRELVISQTPYIVPYRIYGDVIRVLRVLHQAQQWPEDLDAGIQRLSGLGRIQRRGPVPVRQSRVHQ